MVITKTVSLIWETSNKEYYTNKGYVFTNIGDVFNVKVVDLRSRTKVIIECLCDYEGCNKVNKVLYKKELLLEKNYCRYCGVKTTRKIKNDKLYDKIKDEFLQRQYMLVSSNYVDAKSKLKYYCSNHMDKGIMEISYSKFNSRNQGCKYCAYERIADANRFSLEKVQSIFKEKNCLLITEEYVNQKSRLEYICLKHEELGIQTTSLDIYNFNKYGCIQCSRDNSFYSLDFVEEKFKSRNLTLLETEYTGCEVYMRFTCPKHKDIGEQTIQFYELMRGRGCNFCAWEIVKEKVSGVNNYNWKGGIYEDELIKFRKTYEFKKWRRDVLERDSFTCQCCGVVGVFLNAHHLDGYNWCEEKRTDADNGVTLCEDCHIIGSDSFHGYYGYGDNTKEQFEDWIDWRKQQDNVEEDEW